VETIVLGGAGIRFTREWQSDSAWVGVPYTATFSAESSDGGAVIYSLSDAVSGMQIDATTGVFTWTPPTAGYFNVDIVATLAADTAVRATMRHTVVAQYRESDLCAVITGTVSNSKGVTIPYGYVYAIHTINGLKSTFRAEIQNGRFRLPVPAGTSILLITGGAFEPEYYNNAASEQDAEPITLDCGDIRQLSIGVQSFRPNIVEGTLVDTSGANLYGMVIAYRIDNGAIGGSITTGAFGGRFALTNLPPGEYVVWGTGGDSLRGDSSHVPGYHVSGGVAAISWTDATRITVGETDTITGVEIRLVHVYGFQGSARLSGTVVADGGTIRKGDDAGILGLKPVAGAHLFALDASNTIGGYALTDAAGNYTIAGLKPGTFTILADLPGLKPLWRSATVIDGESVLDLTMESTTSGVATASAAAIQGLFPNPVDRSAVLRFNASAGSAELIMSDLHGEKVLTRTITTIDGENRVSIETSGIPAGVYLLRLGTAGAATTVMVTIAH
jgi:hypothetical protein